MRRHTGGARKENDFMHVNRHAVGAFAAAAALLVGGGAALAASPQERTARCDAHLAKLAEKRGVTVEQLQADVQSRLLARIDAAEKAGRLSKERAAKLRERVQDTRLCGDHTRVRATIASRGMLGAAARFLELNRAELRAQLPGNSLAGLAEKQGKRPAALEAAMVAPAKARLAKAVAGGKLSPAQAAKAVAKLEALAHRLATTPFPSK